MRVATLFAITLLLACSDAPKDAKPIAAAVRDSAGVRIVEHPSDWLAHAPQLSLADEPTTEIRDSVHTLDLINMDPPLVLADGRVAMFVERSLLLYGTDGREVERIGRGGAGPGEFRHGLLTRGLGDTLLIQDNAEQRASFVVPGAGVIRTRPLRLGRGDVDFNLIGQSGSDALLLRSTSIIIKPGMREALFYAARADSGVDSVAIVEQLPGPALVERNGMPGMRRYDFKPMAAAWGGELLTIDSRQARLDVRRPDGRLVASIRLPTVPRLTDPDLVAKDIDSNVSFMLTFDREHPYPGARVLDAAEVRKSLASQPVADTIGAVRSVLIGADGVAWIKSGGYHQIDSTWTWTGVARDGRVVGRLTGRGKDRIAAFGANSALTKEEDAEGVLVFRVYSLVVNRKQVSGS